MFYWYEYRGLDISLVLLSMGELFTFIPTSVTHWWTCVCICITFNWRPIRLPADCYKEERDDGSWKRFKVNSWCYSGLRLNVVHYTLLCVIPEHTSHVGQRSGPCRLCLLVYPLLTWLTWIRAWISDYIYVFIVFITFYIYFNASQYDNTLFSCPLFFMSQIALYCYIVLQYSQFT